MLNLIWVTIVVLYSCFENTKKNVQFGQSAKIGTIITYIEVEYVKSLMFKIRLDETSTRGLVGSPSDREKLLAWS